MIGHFGRGRPTPRPQRLILCVPSALATESCNLYHGILQSDIRAVEMGSAGISQMNVRKIWCVCVSYKPGVVNHPINRAARPPGRQGSSRGFFSLFQHQLPHCHAATAPVPSHAQMRGNIRVVDSFDRLMNARTEKRQKGGRQDKARASRTIWAWGFIASQDGARLCQWCETRRTNTRRVGVFLGSVSTLQHHHPATRPPCHLHLTPRPAVP